MSTLVARAPARLDFGGGWTDVPPYSEERGGCVCNVAIERHAIATVQSLGADLQADESAATPDNALALAATRRAGIPDVRVTVQTEFPVGAGLGGSSAAGVAVLGALAAWRGDDVALPTLAEQSRELEVEDMGIAGGRQDHYAAALGGALGLWFGDTVTTRPIALAPATIETLNQRCLVAYTGQSRVSSDTIVAVMDAYRARERGVPATLDRMKTLAMDMIGALEAGDLDALGHLVGEHWVFQRALHPAIPTPTIDRILEDAMAAGALGGKALGASGGGCVLAIAAAGREGAVRRAMAAHATMVPVRVPAGGFTIVRRPEGPRAAGPVA